jgi:hypothetical protein
MRVRLNTVRRIAISFGVIDPDLRCLRRLSGVVPLKSSGCNSNVGGSQPVAASCTRTSRKWINAGTQEKTISIGMPDVEAVLLVNRYQLRGIPSIKPPLSNSCGSDGKWVI